MCCNHEADHEATPEASPAKSNGTPSKRFNKPPEISKPEFRPPPVLEPSPRPKLKVPPVVERTRPRPKFQPPPVPIAKASHLLPEAELAAVTDAISSPNPSGIPLPSSSPNLVASSNTAVSLIAEDPQSSAPDASSNICPICKAPVSSESLSTLHASLATARPHDRSRFNQQAAFCRSHREASGRAEWKRRGYPGIDWTTFTERLGQYRPVMLAVLQNTQPGHFRAELETQLAARRTKGEHARETLAREFMRDGDSAETVGYYGGRGAGAMMNWLAISLAKPLREAQNKDPLVQACGSVSAFVQRVLVPELATLLLVEDIRAKGADEEKDAEEPCKRKIKKSKGKSNDKAGTGKNQADAAPPQPPPTEAEAATARERLKESADLGRLLCQEIDDDIVGEDSEVEILSDVKSSCDDDDVDEDQDDLEEADS
jgi:RTC4-like domain